MLALSVASLQKEPAYRVFSTSSLIFNYFKPNETSSARWSHRIASRSSTDIYQNLTSSSILFQLIFPKLSACRSKHVFFWLITKYSAEIAISSGTSFKFLPRLLYLFCCRCCLSSHFNSKNTSITDRGVKWSPVKFLMFRNFGGRLIWSVGKKFQRNRKIRKFE